MIRKASEQKRIRNLLPAIVDLLHQAGSLVLMEGIETMEQAMIAMDCDVDFVQGFFFAEPSMDYPSLSKTSPSFGELFQKYKKNSKLLDEEI